jgi:hopanoid C-3 methylase
MKILLIQPPKAPTVIGGEDLHVYEPLDLEYLAAGVGTRHEVQILDMRFDKDLAGWLARFAPDVVGLTAYTTHVNVVRALCRRIKEARPEALTVVGGHHATAFPGDFEVEGVDVVVAGEGVFSFRELVDAYEEGRERLRALLDAQGTPGTRTLRSRHNTAALDGYPAPRRDLTRAHRKHYFSEWMKPLATVVTSKGCPFRCGFCCLWKQTEGRYLERSPESIVEELAGLEEENVFFADAESMINAARMGRVAQLIRERGIRKKYYCYSRSDTVVKHPELFRQWREIGLERVFVGFEFFRDGDLDDVHKSASIEENEKAMRTLNALDISMIASFLVKPGFSREDFRGFREYCLRLKRELKFSMFLFSVLTPLPGSDFYEASKSELITHNYDHFDLFHPVLPTKLPMDQFFEELLDLYQKLNGPWEMLPTLLRFKGMEIFRAMQRFGRMAKHMRRAHLDYGVAGVEGARP